MGWNLKVTFKGVAPQGTGIAYLPRGIYKMHTAATKIGTPKGKPGFTLTFKIIEAYVLKDGKLVADPSLTGQSDDAIFMLPDGQDERGDNAREAQIKAALVSHGAMPAEVAQAVAGEQGLSDEHFLGKTHWLIYDPPPAGADSRYAERRYLPADKVASFLSGEAPVAWPQDTKAQRSTGSAPVVPGAASGTNYASAMAASKPAIPSDNGVGGAVTAFAQGPSGSAPPTWGVRN